MTEYDEDKAAIVAKLKDVIQDEDEMANAGLEAAGYFLAEKRWYTSKTFWVNVLAIVGGGVAMLTGYEIGVDPGMLAMGLGGIGLVLRAVTGEALTK